MQVKRIIVSHKLVFQLTEPSHLLCKMIKYVNIPLCFWSQSNTMSWTSQIRKQAYLWYQHCLWRCHLLTWTITNGKNSHRISLLYENYGRLLRAHGALLRSMQNLSKKYVCDVSVLCVVMVVLSVISSITLSLYPWFKVASLLLELMSHYHWNSPEEYEFNRMKPNDEKHNEKSYA